MHTSMSPHPSFLPDDGNFENNPAIILLTTEIVDADESIAFQKDTWVCVFTFHTEFT